MSDDAAHTSDHLTFDEWSDEELAEAEELESWLGDVQQGMDPAVPVSVDQGAYAVARQFMTMAEPLPHFREHLAMRLGLPAGHIERDPSPEAEGMRTARVERRSSRRRWLGRGFAAAAGVTIGVSATLLAQQAQTPAQNQPWPMPLVDDHGIWEQVALLSDIPVGAARRFATDAVVGHIVRRADGSVLALSAACTHMGCIVDWNTSQRTFDCPCHPGRFESDGTPIPGPVAYRPLPRLQVKIENGLVFVYVPQRVTPAPTGGSDYQP